MKRRIVVAMLCGAGALASAPGTAAADECVAVASDGTQVLCYYADLGCVVGTLKGYQYIRPCVQIQPVRP